MRPDDYKFTETHEWVKYSDKKKEAVVGITDYAVHQLSDLVHIELPKVGDSVEAGRPFGEIESVKTVSDLVSPVTGKISAVNSAVADKLDILHESPFDQGWLIKVKPTNPNEIPSLMSAEEYQKFIDAADGGH